jgi:hypothetical protein
MESPNSSVYTGQVVGHHLDKSLEPGILLVFIQIDAGHDTDGERKEHAAGHEAKRSDDGRINPTGGHAIFRHAGKELPGYRLPASDEDEVEYPEEHPDHEQA